MWAQVWDGHLEGQKNPDRLKRSIHVDRIGVHSKFVYIYAVVRVLMIWDDCMCGVSFPQGPSSKIPFVQTRIHPPWVHCLILSCIAPTCHHEATSRKGIQIYPQPIDFELVMILTRKRSINVMSIEVMSIDVMSIDVMSIDVMSIDVMCTITVLQNDV